MLSAIPLKTPSVFLSEIERYFELAPPDSLSYELHIPGKSQQLAQNSTGNLLKNLNNLASTFLEELALRS